MGSLDAIIQSIKKNPIESSGDIYHPIPFAEFKQLKSSVHENAVHHKFKLIRSALPFDNFNGTRILDIGANAGFFSYKFAQLGASVDALEPSSRYYQLGKEITTHYNIDVNWFQHKIDVEFLQGKRYDIALMLSVFQWISQGNTDLDNAKIILGEIARSTDYLFFELGCNWGKSSIEITSPAILWIIDLLRKNTSYSRIGYLGTIRLWGSYKARWRFNRYLFCSTNSGLHLNPWQKFSTWALELR